MADMLLEYGADIDAIVQEEKGYTILMMFCAFSFEMKPKEK